VCVCVWCVCMVCVWCACGVCVCGVWCVCVCVRGVCVVCVCMKYVRVCGVCVVCVCVSMFVQVWWLGKGNRKGVFLWGPQSPGWVGQSLATYFHPTDPGGCAEQS